MNIKSMLYDYSPNYQTIIDFKRELQEIDSKHCASIKAQVITGMPHSSGISKKTEEEALNMIESRKILIREIAKLKEQKNKIDLALTKLTPMQKRIIELRYFEVATPCKISEIIKKEFEECCRMTIWRHHNNAIKIIQEAFDNENIQNAG